MARKSLVNPNQGDLFSEVDNPTIKETVNVNSETQEIHQTKIESLQSTTQAPLEIVTLNSNEDSAFLVDGKVNVVQEKNNQIQDWGVVITGARKHTYLYNEDSFKLLTDKQKLDYLKKTTILRKINNEGEEINRVKASYFLSLENYTPEMAILAETYLKKLNASISSNEKLIDSSTFDSLDNKLDYFANNYVQSLNYIMDYLENCKSVDDIIKLPEHIEDRYLNRQSVYELSMAFNCLSLVKDYNDIDRFFLKKDLLISMNINKEENLNRLKNQFDISLIKKDVEKSIYNQSNKSWEKRIEVNSFFDLKDFFENQQKNGVSVKEAKNKILSAFGIGVYMDLTSGHSLNEKNKLSLNKYDIFKNKVLEKNGYPEKDIKPADCFELNMCSATVTKNRNNKISEPRIKSYMYTESPTQVKKFYNGDNISLNNANEWKDFPEDILNQLKLHNLTVAEYTDLKKTPEGKIKVTLFAAHDSMILDKFLREKFTKNKNIDFKESDKEKAATEEKKEKIVFGKHDVKPDENIDIKKISNKSNATEVLKEFGIYDVQFGNWVGSKKDGNERQHNLNNLIKSLYLLQKIYNIPDTDRHLVGQSGLLKWAFGARGVPGQSASFNVEKSTINLTRLNGAGSVAHEYSHFIDYSLCQMLLKPEVKYNNTVQLSLMKELGLNSGGKFLSEISLMLNNYLENNNMSRTAKRFIEDNFNIKNFTPSQKELIKNMVEYINTIKIDNNKHSDFYQKAIDADKSNSSSGKKYYSLDVELYARSMECVNSEWIKQHLEEKDYSDYLVPSYITKCCGYPSDKEMDNIKPIGYKLIESINKVMPELAYNCIEQSLQKTENEKAYFNLIKEGKAPSIKGISQEEIDRSIIAVDENLIEIKQNLAKAETVMLSNLEKEKALEKEIESKKPKQTNQKQVYKLEDDFPF